MDFIEINSILFSGKRSFPWKKVEEYLSKYSGSIVTIKETGERIIIGSHFASEYCGSKYTQNLHGSVEKAKANAVQILPDLIREATNRRWVDNKDKKHGNDAKNGWYRYDVHFSMLVVFDGKVTRNYYRGTLIARVNDMGIYAHDIINIKKEDSEPFESQDRTV